MTRKEAIWLKLMNFGNRVGCHQRPDRSFFFYHYQFPFCARCTGLIIGQFLLFPLVNLLGFHGSYLISFALLVLMFLDWVLQALQWLDSNNIRRLITGILGGYALITILVLVGIDLYYLVN